MKNKYTHIYSVLEVIKELNCIIKGTSDFTEKHNDMYRWLKWRITKEWSPSIPSMQAIDLQILRLARVVVHEYAKFERKFEVEGY